MKTHAEKTQTVSNAGMLRAETPTDEISLLDILDNVLTSGVVIHGSIVISLAGVDLVYLGLNAVLTSVETALRHIDTENARIESSHAGTGGARRR